MTRQPDDTDDRPCPTFDDLWGEVSNLRAQLIAMKAERDEAVNWSDIVERYGTDQFDDLAEKWLAMESIQRVHNAVASVFSKWANDELISRFKKHMSNSLQIAFVEGCLAGVRAAEAKASATIAKATQKT